MGAATALFIAVLLTRGPSKAVYDEQRLSADHLAEARGQRARRGLNDLSKAKASGMNSNP